MRIIKFFISGSLAALVYFGVSILFTEIFGFWYWIGANIAYFAAFGASFALQKYWTFAQRGKNRLAREIVLYALVALFNFFLHAGLVYIFVDVWEMRYLLGQACAALIISFISFFAYSAIFSFPSSRGGARILIATPLYPPEIGGPATYTSILETKLPKMGIEVTVVKYASVRFLPKGLSHLAYFLLVLQKGFDSDIIYAQDPVSVGFPAMCAAKILGKKFVLKVVGDYAWEQYQQNQKSPARLNDFSRSGGKVKNQKFLTPEEFQNGHYGFKSELHRKIERLVARAAKKIIVPSKYLKRIVALWGISESNIEVIYNAFEFTNFHLSKEEARRKLKLMGTSIISSGRMVPWKGFATLIEAFKRIHQEFPETRLYIIGDGPDRDALTNKARALGISDNVQFLGKIPHDVLLLWLRAGHLFVLNTGYEGLSHVLLEAMASETPIITTRVGGNTELIHGNNK